MKVPININLTKELVTVFDPHLVALIITITGVEYNQLIAIKEGQKGFVFTNTPEVVDVIGVYYGVSSKLDDEVVELHTNMYRATIKKYLDIKNILNGKNKRNTRI